MDTKYTKLSKKCRDEIVFLEKTDHPNIIHTISVEELSEGGCLITMEDMAAGTLADFVNEHGKLSAADVISVGKKLCAAVGYLHGLTPPWLFCDMKPENVLITGSPGKIDQVVLIDIDGGCPMKLDGLVPEESYGTKGYAAPEQMDPEGPLDFRVDVYGICATMDGVYHRHKLLKGSRGRALEAVIAKCMSERPQNRYFTVKELSDALCGV